MLCRAALALPFAALARPGLAQSFPSRRLRITVSAAAGAILDILAHALAPGTPASRNAEMHASHGRDGPGRPLRRA